MTVCVAWLRGQYAFLAADSALTTTGRSLTPSATHSSFGEAPHIAISHIVEEGAVKVFELGERLLGAFCGDVADGTSCLRRIRRSVQMGRTHRDAVSEHQGREGKSIVVVLGIESGAVHMWMLDNGRVHEAYDERHAVIGSLPTSEKSFVSRTLDELGSHEVFRNNPDDYLAAVVIGLQAHGQRFPLLGHGVGGAFWGLALGPEGVLRFRDTLYVVYDRDDDLPARVRIDDVLLVLCGWRGQVAFTWGARHMPATRLFVGDMPYMTDDATLALIPSIVRAQPEYLALVERTSGSVLVAQRASCDDESLFSIGYGDQATRVRLSDRLVERLLAFPTDAVARTTGHVPFDFIWSGSPAWLPPEE